MTLDDLRIDQHGVITECLGNDAAVCRLSEMGLVPGVSVRLVRRAFLGGPIEIQVGQTHLAIRRYVAQNVRIEVVESGHAGESSPQ